MNSQTIAAALATIVGLAVAAYAFAYVSVGGIPTSLGVGSKKLKQKPQLFRERRLLKGQ
jgi:hypothetical protein